MDEREWLTAEWPIEMVYFIRHRASDRKHRLFACACCRHIWHLILNSHARFAVELAERFSDGLSSEAERASAFGDVPLPLNDRAAYAALGASCFSAYDAADSWGFAAEAAETAGEEQRAKELLHQAGLLRCIFGDPFRPATFDRPLRPPVIFALAQAAYDNRILPAGTIEPDRLAVLADALEEGGCTDAEVLGHLHGPGPYVRGCFVIDLILDKK